jgi:hypothetical protein
MTRRHASWVVAALTLATVGCSKKAGEGGVHMKEVHEAFAGAGFKLDSFHPADPTRFSAQKCAEGTLDGVDTIVCEFGSSEAVVLGKKAGEAWIAQATTGAVLDSGRTLLAVADRGHADPNGQVIHKITQAYSRLK